MAVLAEGLMEAIGEEKLRRRHGRRTSASSATIELDAFGHLRLGEIEFGRMIRDHARRPAEGARR